MTDTCSIGGCTTSLGGRSYRGMCERHYKIERAAGRLDLAPKAETRTPSDRELRAAGLDEFEWLIDGGTPPEQAARRSGVTVTNAAAIYRRHGWTVPRQLLEADSRARNTHG